VGLLRILADEDRLWIASDQDIDGLVRALDRLLVMEEAEIRSSGSDLRTFAIAGPESRIRIERALGKSLGWAEGIFDHRRIGPNRVVRSELGFDLAVPSDQAGAVAASLESAGIARGDESEWDRRSLEAGLPIYGVDVDENTILSELGGRGIDYEKGCYIGQEVVAKIRYIGHVNRHLVGLRLDGADGEDLPERGAVLVRGGKEVGFLTRAADSSEAGGVIAFGYVRHGSQDAGNEFVVGGGPATATVVSLPFVP
jgi:aminomethyltransferase